MFQALAIQQCLAGLVGLFPADDPSYPPIDSDLTASASGLIVQGAHPLVSIENLVNSAPEFKSFQYPEWALATAYNAKARVIYTGKVYEARGALGTGLALSPDGDPGNWKAIDPFSEWLRRIYQQSCSNLALTIVRQKALQNAGKTLLDSQRLYQGNGMLADRIIKRGRFVGFEITTLSAEGLVTVLSKVGIQTDAMQTLRFYLYNNSQAAPVQTFDISLQSASTFAWADLTGAVIGYVASGTDAGSSWYFGYYEDDLVGQAVNKTMDFSRPPCQSCDQWNTAAYNQWSRYTTVRAIYVSAADINGDKSIWEGHKLNYSYDSNWGLNVAITVSCDISDVICANKWVVANALRMQIAVDLLNVIGFTTRINAVSETTRKMARAELSTKAGATTFMNMYLDEVTNANLNLSGLNGSCFPCTSRGTVRYSSI